MIFDKLCLITIFFGLIQLYLNCKKNEKIIIEKNCTIIYNYISLEKEIKNEQNKKR